MQADVAEVFTMAARQAVPVVARRHQGLAFDFRGPRLLIHDNIDNLRCCLHRLLCGMSDALDHDGVMIFSCEATETGPHVELCTMVAGAGSVSGPERVNSILQRLSLVETTNGHAGHIGHRLAKGLCPAVHAPVDFAWLPREGAVFKVAIHLSRVEAPPQEESCSAEGARGWVIDPSPVTGDSLARRLQRLGWAVTRFDSCTRAAVSLRHAELLTSRPALLIVGETEAGGPAAQRLRALLPASTRLVAAVMAGSPLLRVPQPINGFEVHVMPFSPADLMHFTAGRNMSKTTPNGHTRPTPLSWSNRPLVLIVDDNELNLVIGRGLVEASGYDVITARNGLDAIAQCRRIPPQAVLMDIDMPVMDGIEATRRLREMQLLGQIPPFPIIGATAGGAIASADECFQAGMDGYLTKPLRVRLLQEELRRVAALR